MPQAPVFIEPRQPPPSTDQLCECVPPSWYGAFPLRRRAASLRAFEQPIAPFSTTTDEFAPRDLTDAQLVVAEAPAGMSKTKRAPTAASAAVEERIRTLTASTEIKPAGSPTDCV